MFLRITKTLSDAGLKDKPAQIYNCDESGMPLEFKIPKVIAAKSTKKVRQCISGSKTQITILACASGSGQTLPPMVVFAGKNLNSVLARGSYFVRHVFVWLDGQGVVCELVFTSFSGSCRFQ